MGSTQSVGADYIPLLLTDAVASPPETATFYSERLVHLPQHFFPASHRHSEPPAEASTWLKRDAVSAVLPPPTGGVCVFAILNDASKVTPSVAKTWMTILEGAPASAVLWTSLNTNCSAAILRSSRAPQLSDRVKAHRFEGHADFRRAYRRADVFLDTPNYCGQNTALLGIWLGVAMLTVPGELQKQRALASMLVTHGAPQTITRTLDEYRAVALQLAHRPSMLLAHRKRMQQINAKSALFDMPRYVAGLERALTTMWDLHINDATSSLRHHLCLRGD